MSKKESLSAFTFYPLTNKRWNDLEKLFGERGACGGCWCMWWRLKRSVYNLQKGAKNKNAFKKIVSSGKAPGILAYHYNEPAGWCAITPRDDYPVLDNSRVLKRIDDAPVWSITCFFIAKEFRNKGLSVKLLSEAIKFAKIKNAKIVEGYPMDSKNKMPAAFAWTGFASAFLKAGFKEAARRSETRPIMRYYI